MIVKVVLKDDSQISFYGVVKTEYSTNNIEIRFNDGHMHIIPIGSIKETEHYNDNHN